MFSTAFTMIGSNTVDDRQVVKRDSPTRTRTTFSRGNHPAWNQIRTSKSTVAMASTVGLQYRERPITNTMEEAGQATIVASSASLVSAVRVPMLSGVEGKKDPAEERGVFQSNNVLTI